LQPIIWIHGRSLEFLGTQHRQEQVDEKGQGYATGKQGFHGVLLKRLATAQIGGTDNEKQQRRANVNEIVHGVDRTADDCRSCRIMFPPSHPSA
jgi:hypothetical protein